MNSNGIVRKFVISKNGEEKLFDDFYSALHFAHVVWNDKDNNISRNMMERVINKTADQLNQEGYNAYAITFDRFGNVRNMINVPIHDGLLTYTTNYDQGAAAIARGHDTIDIIGIFAKDEDEAIEQGLAIVKEIFDLFGHVKNNGVIDSKNFKFGV